MGIMFDKNDVMYATNMADFPDAHLYQVDIGTGIATDLGALNLSFPHGGGIYIPIDTCVPPPSGLIAGWSGEGNAYDITGTNNGTLMNGATFAASKVGQGFNLDGIDDYLDAGTSETFNFNDGMGDFTIGAWIRLAEYSAGSSKIVSRGSQEPYSGWSFQVDSNGALALMGNGVWELTSNPGAISVGNWAYVAVAKSGNTSKLYKDGIEIASAVYGDLQTSVEPLTIGSGFKGIIDEVVIFNRALTSSEIAVIFNADSAGICKPTSDLEISGLSAPPTGIPGSAIDVNDTTRNNGSGTAGASTTRYYWSVNNVYDSGDVLLGSRSIPSLGAGATSAGSTSVTIPSGAASGTYYIIARADADGIVTETNETNNTASISIIISDTRPDFTSGAALTPSTSVTSGSTITFGVGTKNVGVFTAGASTTRVYLSTDATINPGDLELGSVVVPSLAPTNFYFTNISVTIPPGTASGTYYIITKADADGIIAETNETNNGKSYAITVTSSSPDLVVSDLTGPASAIADQTVSVNDTTRNNGSGTAGASTTRYYWSVNNVYDSGDVLLGSRSIPSLGAGATSAGSTSVTIPSGAASGTYYIIARADADGIVTETNETNNTASISIIISDTRPDFTSGAALTPSTSVTSGSTITFGVGTKNVGVFTAGASTTRVYLSTDATINPGDLELGSVVVPSLAPTNFYFTNISVTIPPGTASGTYYIITKADADGIIAETNETNNGKSYAITVTQRVSKNRQARQFRGS